MENPKFQEKISTFLKKRSKLPGFFWSPPETLAKTKDPGNERFRIRSDSRKIFIKKYLKTKKFELLQENRKTINFVQKVRFLVCVQKFRTVLARKKRNFRMRKLGVAIMRDAVSLKTVLFA